MKLLGLILLLSILTLISGKSSFLPLLPITDSVILKCLKNSGYMDLAFTYMNYGSTDHVWTATTSPESISNAGTKPDIVLSLQTFKWSSFSPEVYSNEIARQFTSIEVRMFWLAPSILVSTNKPTCQNIYDFAKALTAKTGFCRYIFEQSLLNEDFWRCNSMS